MTIQEAKAVYGHVYSVDIEGVPYIYRPLTIGEYRIIYMGTALDCDKQDAIVYRCLLSPPDIDLDKLPGMLPETLCHYILTSSMLDNDEDWEPIVSAKELLLRRERGSDGVTRIKDSIGAIMCTITRAFPGTDIIKLGEVTVDRLLDMLAIARYQLGMIEGTKTERLPTTIPVGLSEQDKQSLREQISAEASTIDLRKKWNEDKKKFQMDQQLKILQQHEAPPI